MVKKKATQPGLQDHCPNNWRGSLSNEPEPVEMQLQILWPGGAERLKMVSFNLVSVYLKVQHATINLRLKYRIIWVASRNK